MSKLDKLLRELCPNGVEYKKLGEIATISRGGNFQKKDFLTEGVPCIHYGQIYTKYGLFTDKTFTFISEECAKKQKMAQPNDIVMAVTSENIEDVCKCLAWLGDEPAAISGHSAIIHHNQNAKYLVYYFHSQMFFAQKRKLAHGTKVIEVTPDALVDITLPLPPIEVQREIVRMLDSYTESVVELQRQLTAELTARKAQYSHYRDKLLSYTSTAQMEKLGDTCEMKAGKAIASGLISDERTEETPIKCYGGNGVRGYVKNANENGSYPIIGRQGALCGNVKYAEGQFYATEHAVVVKPKEKYNPRFLYHLLTNMNLNQYKSAGAQPGLAVKNIAELVAPVPPLNVQNRIVNVLDNFEKICSDLNIGLPAEIEARQKQYEYYRDKLLTFAENGNTILSRAEQSRAEQSRAEQSRALIKLLQYVFGYAVVTLEDIAENCDSMRKPVTSGKREAGEYPYYGASGIVDYVKDYIFDGDYLLVSEDGANLLARSTPIAFSISGKNWVNNHAHVLKIDRYETRRFVEFYLNSIDLAPYISGGAQPKLNQKNLNRIEIPLPSQERQKYIVDILDRFDAICNDLTSGLPAEIEARRKQYEYYRDKLLSFKELI
uniref:restriction endonuclease subunit S n=1 Tax=Faecalibacterium prausnitzii TaxID=853 RepID=UPI004025D71D